MWPRPRVDRRRVQVGRYAGVRASRLAAVRARGAIKLVSRRSARANRRPKAGPAPKSVRRKLLASRAERVGVVPGLGRARSPRPARQAYSSQRPHGRELQLAATLTRPCTGPEQRLGRIQALASRLELLNGKPYAQAHGIAVDQSSQGKLTSPPPVLARLGASGHEGGISLLCLIPALRNQAPVRPSYDDAAFCRSLEFGVEHPISDRRAAWLVRVTSAYESRWFFAGYALVRVFGGVILATPADGVRMLVCPSSQRTRTREGSSWSTSSITPARSVGGSSARRPVAT